MTLDILYLTAAVVLGAIVGSFLNVVILRLPQGTFRSGGNRSSCPKCSAPIRVWDNIPVLSFLLLGARCRGCKAPISWRYPLVELMTAVLFGWLYYASAFPVVEHIPVLPGGRITDEHLSVMPGIVAFVFHGAFLALLVASSFIDWDHRILPDALDIPGAILGGIGAVVVPGLAGSFAAGDGTAVRITMALAVAAIAVGAVRLLLGKTATEMVRRDEEAIEYAQRSYDEEIEKAEAAGDDASAASARARKESLAGGLGTVLPRAGSGAIVALAVAAAAFAVARGEMWLDVALYGVAAVPVSWALRCLWFKARHWGSGVGFADFYFADRPGIVLGVAAAAVGAGLGYGVVGDAPAWLVSLRFSALGAVTGVGFTWSIRWFFGKLFQQEAMGFGDVKFMGMIGAFVGWEGAILTFFLASLFGALGGTVHRLVTGDAKVPFGPFLAMGAVVSLFYQRKVRDVLVDWPRWVQGSPAAPWIAIGLGVVCLILLRSVVRKGRRHTSEVREE